EVPAVQRHQPDRNTGTETCTTSLQNRHRDHHNVAARRSHPGGWDEPPPEAGAHPIQRGGDHAAALITPNKPWLSSAGPAVKNSEFVGPETLPVPNSSAQSPSIVTGTPPAPRRTPACSKSPFAPGAYALILPSPKSPTSRSPLT